MARHPCPPPCGRASITRLHSCHGLAAGSCVPFPGNTVVHGLLSCDGPTEAPPAALPVGAEVVAQSIPACFLASSLKIYLPFQNGFGKFSLSRQCGQATELDLPTPSNEFHFQQHSPGLRVGLSARRDDPVSLLMSSSFSLALPVPHLMMAQPQSVAPLANENEPAAVMSTEAALGLQVAWQLPHCCSVPSNSHIAKSTPAPGQEQVN